MKVNTKKLKSLLALQDYEKILQDLNIPIYTKSKQQWIYWTGDKNADALKGSPKLYFYPDTKIYFGYTAGRSYDIIALVQTRLEITKQAHGFIDAVNFILASTGIDSDACQRITKKNTYDWEDTLGKYLKIKSGVSILKTYDETILEQLPDVYPQNWIDEGININTMIKYGIKYYPRLQATAIPCRDKEGNLIGIRCRHWLPEEIDKGKYRPLQLLNNTIYSFPTNKVFYGINYNWAEIERTGHVILCEGEKGTLKADSWWREKSNVLALYGSNIGINRVKELVRMGVNHVTLALDSDFHEIGDDDYINFEKKIIKLAELFQGFAEVDVIYNNIELPSWYKCSPFDGDEETWNQLWENRETIE